MSGAKNHGNYLDVLIVDWHGGLRGKRLPESSRDKILAGQARIPLSTQAMDIWGDDRDEITQLGLSHGDPDGFCIPGDSRFITQPWNPGNEQILCSLQRPDGVFSDFDVRAQLQKRINALATQGLYPVVAIELEFYLMDASTLSTGKPAIPHQLTVARAPNELQLYDMRAMDRVNEVLTQIHAFADAMDIPTEATLAEYGPGQFEINLEHQSDALLAADHAVLFKQLVDRVASQFGLLASFMAKPYTEHGSSGQHVHVSLLNDQGKNIFDQPQPEKLLHAVAGALNHLEQSQLLFAPHANSYRRLQPGGFAPARQDWGMDHRGVALRIPESTGPAARIEHRVAGSDANPYLVVNAILAALQIGLAQGQNPESAALQPGDQPNAPYLTHDWLTAIERFEQSDFNQRMLGADFCKTYVAIKRFEAQKINALVPDTEISTYLTRV